MDHSHHGHDHGHNHAENGHNLMTTVLANVSSSIATTVASITHTKDPNLINSSLAEFASNVTSTIGTVLTQASPNVLHAHHDGDMSGMDGHVHDKDMPGMDHGMEMYFQFGLNATILFKEWKVHTVGGMIGSVIGVILIAILYEGIKFLREYLFRKSYSRLSYSTCAVTGSAGCDSTGAELHKVTENKMFGFPHLLQTALHVVQIILSYFLMLIFMTFNLWLCFGVLLGSAIGYFCFGWRKSTIVDVSDHCH